MKLLYNEEEHFCTKTGLLNFKITLPLAKLDVVGSRFLSTSSIFLDDILVIIQLVTFLISELSIEAKTKKPSAIIIIITIAACKFHSI